MTAVDVVFERPEARRIGKRLFTDEEQQLIRVVASRALDLASRAHAVPTGSLARWMGVLSPENNLAVRKGAEAMHAALAGYPIGFVVGTGPVNRISVAGTAPPPPWMDRAAQPRLMRTGSCLGEEIVLGIDGWFFGAAEEDQVLHVFRYLAYQVLRAVDVSLPVVGPAWHPSLCQRLAGAHPTWGLLNGASWGFYLSSIGYHWR
jgi:hypothetical protein